MPILRNQAKAGPLHAGVPGEVLSAYRDGPWFRCHASCTSARKSIFRSDRFRPAADAARSRTSSQALLLREVARDDLCYPDEIIRPQKLRRGAVVTGFSLISVQY